MNGEFCIRTIALGVLRHCILSWMDFECSIRFFLTLQKREETGWACMLPSRNILVEQKMTPSSLSALSGFYGGLTTKLYLHNRGKVRVSWVQNVGAVLTNFSFGVGSATPFAKSKWGVGLQEAIKYDYIFSSGAAFGVKGYIDYSHLFRNSSFSGFTVNPQHVTSLGIAASFSF